MNLTFFCSVKCPMPVWDTLSIFYLLNGLSIQLLAADITNSTQQNLTRLLNIQANSFIAPNHDLTDQIRRFYWIRIHLNIRCGAIPPLDTFI